MYEKMATFVLFFFFFFFFHVENWKGIDRFTPICIYYLIERKYSLKIIIPKNIEDWKG